MKILRTISAAVLVLATLDGGARTAAEVFVDAPVGIVPTLAKNTRMDMLDYFRSGLQTPSSNSLDGKSRITEETPGALSVQLSRDASMQLVVLPERGDSVVAVIETVLTPLADSNIRFYSLKTWKPLARQAAIPGIEQFVQPGTSVKDFKMPPYLFVRAEYKPDEDLFVFTNTTEAFYVGDDRPDGMSRLKPVLKMKYTPRKFVEVKE